MYLLLSLCLYCLLCLCLSVYAVVCGISLCYTPAPIQIHMKYKINQLYIPTLKVHDCLLTHLQ